MRRPLEVEHELGGVSPDVRGAFGSDPGRWLPEPARWHSARRWNVRLAAGRLSRTVRCEVGEPWRLGDEGWRRLSWEPIAEPGDALPVDRGLPAFDGELGLVERGTGTVLVLRGTYQPPGGFLGAAADAAGLQRVALATATVFLDEVGGRLRVLARQDTEDGEDTGDGP